MTVSCLVDGTHRPDSRRRRTRRANLTSLTRNNASSLGIRPLAIRTAPWPSPAHVSRGIPLPGPHSWLNVPQPEGLPGIDGYAAELGLETELPSAIGQYPGIWIEYGVAERAYALRCPVD